MDDVRVHRIPQETDSFTSASLEAKPTDGAVGLRDWRFFLPMGAFLFTFGTLFGYILWQDTSYSLSAYWRVIIGSLAPIVMLTGLYMFFLPFARESASFRRIESAHEATFLALEGDDTERGDTVNLTVDSFAGMLTILFWLHYEMQRGETAPWRVDHASGELQIRKGTRLVGIGRMSETQSRKLGKKLAELGLITGHGQGHSGRWIGDGYAESVKALAGKWGD